MITKIKILHITWNTNIIVIHIFLETNKILYV